MTIMEDELKNYTQQNRPDFELYKLDVEQAWQPIERRLDIMNEKGIRVLWRRWLKVAALLVLMFSIAFGYYLIKQRLEINRYGIALQDLSSELADIEFYYIKQIDEKLDMIRTENGPFHPGMLAQIEIFEADYRSLRRDLKDDADSEEVINAIIKHYRLKLSMLEKILEEVQKDHENKDDDELQDI